MIGIIGVLVFLQITVFSPRTIDAPDVNTNRLNRGEILYDYHRNRPVRAPGLPKDRVPEYAIEGLKFVSISGSTREWKLDAQRAFMYRIGHQYNVTHSRDVRTVLYGENGQDTFVTGDEGKYTDSSRDLELYGNVKAVLPDGMIILSDYMKYLAKDRRISVPPNYKVTGTGKFEDAETLDFTDYGLDMAIGSSIVNLSRDVVFRITDEKGDTTIIHSDQAVFNRKARTAIFTMNADRPPASRFVKVNQPDLYVQGREVRFDFNSKQKLEYMTALEDVTIRELKKGASLKYATCGRADFNRKRNVAVLTRFPQAYQDNDTVTGDRITLYRDRDIVEVDYSNAFSRGQK
jgi:LPS export ABC transporter protein LptC